MAFDVPAGTQKCHMLLDVLDGKTVYVRQVDAEGNYIAEFPVSSSYFTCVVKPGVVKMELVGTANVFETIFSR